MKRLIVGSMVVLLACGRGGEAGSEGEAAGEAGGEAMAALGNSTITGVMSFAGSVPENPTIDMAEEPECVGKYADTPRDPQVVVTDGNLANVFIYVKSGLPEGQRYPTSSAPVVLDQDGCLYHPRVLGVMVGQDVEIRNSDPLLHNVKARPSANRVFNFSQPQQGMTRKHSFRSPEVMIALECNVHGWMNAYVGVLDHPFFAVSAEDGTFTISGLPAGTYEVEAWHEKFGAQTVTVTVPEDGSASADFTFSAQAALP